MKYILENKIQLKRKNIYVCMYLPSINHILTKNPITKKN